MALNPPITQAGTPFRVDGEFFLLHRDKMEFEVKIQNGVKHSAKGKIYLTTCRIVFISDKFNKDVFKSFDIPLGNLYEEKFEQPVFGSNYLEAKVRPLFNLIPGIGTFKLWFTAGGCGTFLKCLDQLLKQIRSRARQGQFGVDPRFEEQVRTGNIQNQQALFDPNDPSIIYVTQPVDVNNNNQFYGNQQGNPYAPQQQQQQFPQQQFQQQQFPQQQQQFPQQQQQFQQQQMMQPPINQVVISSPQQQLEPVKGFGNQQQQFQQPQQQQFNQPVQQQGQQLYQPYQPVQQVQQPPIQQQQVPPIQQQGQQLYQPYQPVQQVQQPPIQQQQVPIYQPYNPDIAQQQAKDQSNYQYPPIEQSNVQQVPQQQANLQFQQPLNQQMQQPQNQQQIQQVPVVQQPNQQQQQPQQYNSNQYQYQMQEQQQQGQNQQKYFGYWGPNLKNNNNQ